MSNIIGNIIAPPGVNRWAANQTGAIQGLIPFLSALIKLLIVIAGLYAFINLILAGYGFMSAGGDSKKVEQAWSKIWQSLIGLLLIAGSFILAAIFGSLLFNDAFFILKPNIYGPGP